MALNITKRIKRAVLSTRFFIFLLFPVSLSALFFASPELFGDRVTYDHAEQVAQGIGLKADEEVEKVPSLPPLDKADYDRRMNNLANNPVPDIETETVDPNEDSTLDTAVVNILSEEKGSEEETQPIKISTPEPTLWPVQTAYPNDGAILPFKRIIAYYGNLYSRKMGVLGEYDEEEMLAKLDVEVKKWEEADPDTPVQPALHYIAVVAQASAGVDGKYRFRMPDAEIDKVLAMAEKIDAIVFLDLQVGFSDLQTEVPYFEKYLKMSNVHLGVDAEFSMKNGIRPGKVVGTLDAEDLNFTTGYLAELVRENDLTPKVLVVHRYTLKMITNYKQIKTPPEVQIVMHMDGWGGKAKKRGTYRQVVYREPVQFAGFKLFYKNDIFTPGTTLMTPSEILELRPKPIYIQYQ